MGSSIHSLVISSILDVENWKSNATGDLEYNRSTTSETMTYGCLHFSTKLSIKLNFEKIEANITIFMSEIGACSDENVTFGYRVEVIGDNCGNAIEEQRDPRYLSNSGLEWKEHGTYFSILNPKRNSSSEMHVTVPLDWDRELYYCKDVQFLVHIRALSGGLLHDNSAPISAGVISYSGFTEIFPAHVPNDLLMMRCGIVRVRLCRGCGSCYLSARLCLKVRNTTPLSC